MWRHSRGHQLFRRLPSVHATRFPVARRSLLSRSPLPPYSLIPHVNRFSTATSSVTGGTSSTPSSPPPTDKDGDDTSTDSVASPPTDSSSTASSSPSSSSTTTTTATTTTDSASAAPTSSSSDSSETKDDTVTDSSEEEKKEEEEDPADSSTQLLPKEVVDQLDRYIIGQKDAKKAVAIAFRNRWRRHRVDKDMKDEIMPKNILMVGPTGCGKTEIARRLAKLADAPFLKIEATKFTEIGFHGRDVDSIIRDLIEISIVQTKARRRKKVLPRVKKIVEEKIIDNLISQTAPSRTKASWRKLLEDGEVEDVPIDIDISAKFPDSGAEIPVGSGSGLLDRNPAVMLEIRRMWHQGDSRRERKNVPIREARKLLTEAETEKLLSNEDILKESIRSAEQDGIVFIDEIDKICTSSSSMHSSADASAEGVQRDLLPLVEGSTVVTKHGNVNTDHIMFIASGAFHSVKPSDMMAELQGRLPIRVELKGLSVEDLERILKEPEFNLLKQESAMLATEGVAVTYEDDAIKEIARVAADLNFSAENIGARRLIHVVEKVMEDISFEAASPDRKSEVNVTREYVDKQCRDISQKVDLSKFIM